MNGLRLMRNLINLALLIALMSVQHASAGEAGTDQGLQNRIIRSLDWQNKASSAEDPIKKIEYYTEAIKLDPMASLYVMRAVAYYEIGECHSAIQDADTAVKKEADFMAFAVRGWCYLTLSNAEKAVDDLTTAIQLDKSSLLLGMNYSMRASGFAKLKMYGRGVDDLTEAIKFFPNTGKLQLLAELYVRRARLYLALSEPEKVLKDTNEALRLKPTSGDALLLRGAVFLYLSEREPTLRPQAISDFRSACRLGKEVACKY